MIYKEIIKSKNNLDVPVLLNGKSLHSKYAPEKEAENFGTEINESSAFTIILGLGGGWHVKSFLDRNPNHYILVIENSEEDILFLSQIECVKALLKNKNVKIIPKEKISENILKTYLPSFYGGINIICNRSWFEYDGAESKKIIDEINSAIKICSKDFSVQSHFGLIWQKNILNNLKVSSELKEKEFKFDVTKTAAVLAAGPSLDMTIEKIISERDRYFVIATDTAFSICGKRKILPDAVVSIDGQNISYKHFLGGKTDFPIFIFDLQANLNAVNFVKNAGAEILFIKSGHPFSSYAELCTAEKNAFLPVNCGAGTVTIAAVDFARKAGFEKIQVYGADFSYIFNKPYAKGTYLDALYRTCENRILPAENSFVNLLYRTPVTKSKIAVSSVQTEQIKNEVLDSYRKTFLEWLNENCKNISYENFVYVADCTNQTSNGKNNSELCKVFKRKKFSYEAFLNRLKKESEKILSDQKPQNSIADLTELEISVLPFIAFIRNKYKKLDFNKSLKLALTKILEYTK
ncbi:MAG: 6-hydroxymethylpterin diphosphokinase MptE-like protein [Treponema sp.]